MFAIEIHPAEQGPLVVVSRPTDRQTHQLLNVPLSRMTRERLARHLVGSIPMGTSALLEWGLQELERQGITLEVQAQE
jgi:hypothetical protein